MIELGPGTGVVTKALIERGVARRGSSPSSTIPDFCRLLARALPGRHRASRATPTISPARCPTGARRPRLGGRVEPAARLAPAAGPRRLIEAALDRMAPGRPFIQFSYMPHAAGRAGARPLHRRGLALDLAEPAAGAGLALPPRRRLRRPGDRGPDDAARRSSSSPARSAPGRCRASSPPSPPRRSRSPTPM